MGNGKKVMGAVLYSMKEEKKSHGRNNKQKLKKKEVMRPTVQSMPLQLFLKYLKDKIIFKKSRPTNSWYKQYFFYYLLLQMSKRNEIDNSLDSKKNKDNFLAQKYLGSFWWSKLNRNRYNKRTPLATKKKYIKRA